MTIKKYRVHDWVKFNYSEIGEYIGEGYTDKPLRNDEIVELLNQLSEENEQLKSENKELQGKASSWKITASEQMMEQSKLMKENGQLKQRIKQLADVDRLIDEKIEEYLNIPSLSDGALIVLKELKKELEWCRNDC